MYKGKTVSVVFATYKEKNSVRMVIEDFFSATPYVDEIVVVNNNAEPGTVEEVQKTKARMVYEKRQGYGYTYQTGVKEATGDYVILCEPDGTYAGHDVEQFLVYARKGFDVVLGSRTGLTKPAGGSMGFLRKYANVFEGKTIELLFNTNALSDVGCTYKLLTRKAINKLSPLWHTRGGLFATELVLLTITERLRFVEVPITFSERVGVSVMVNSIRKLIKWGLLIYAFIFFFWFRWIFRKFKSYII